MWNNWADSRSSSPSTTPPLMREPDDWKPKKKVKWVREHQWMDDPPEWAIHSDLLKNTTNRGPVSEVERPGRIWNFMKIVISPLGIAIALLMFWNRPVWMEYLPSIVSAASPSISSPVQQQSHHNVSESLPIQSPPLVDDMNMVGDNCSSSVNHTSKDVFVEDHSGVMDLPTTWNIHVASSSPKSPHCGKPLLSALLSRDCRREMKRDKQRLHPTASSTTNANRNETLVPDQDSFEQQKDCLFFSRKCRQWKRLQLQKK
jgi:hypothetical protein